MYIITDDAQTYQVPIFTVDPDWCEIAYTFSVDDMTIVSGGVVNFISHVDVR